MSSTTTTLRTGTDQHGNPASGSSDSIARYDAAIDRLLRYHVDVIDQMMSLATDEPEFAMGQVLAAHLTLTSTDAPDVPGAREVADHLRTLPLNEREAAHLAAIDAWAAGDWHGAARQLDALLVRWPADLLALQVGHQLDFFLGDAANLRDRVGRSLFALDPEHPHQGFVLGMQSFGLEEAGSYEHAEAAGMEAIERNPDDVWAIHAVVHTYEMRGMVAQGIGFLQSREPDWGTGNLFNVHNWWHLAIYLLEAGRIDEALAIYDQRIHHAGSDGVPLEMLDASALLWRLLLDGEDTGGRFGPLADAWATRTDDEPWYAFNDLHAVVALTGAGRLGDARAVVERLARFVEAPLRPTSQHWMISEVGLPASRAVVALAEGRDDDAVADLLPIRTTLQRFGGSHAQRDLLQRTLLESALRSGRLDLARALVSERLALRGTSVYGRTRQASLLRSQGDVAGAVAAESAAAAQRAVFAAAFR